MNVAFDLKNKMLDKLRMGIQGAIKNDIKQRRSAYGKFYDLNVKVNENVRFVSTRISLIPNQTRDANSVASGLRSIPDCNHSLTHPNTFDVH